MSDLGKLLIFFGIILVALGVILNFAGRIPLIGRLPGDVYIQKKNFTFFFPLTTSIILSILISLVLFLFKKFR